jgi:hypothetical protein
MGVGMGARRGAAAWSPAKLSLALWLRADIGTGASWTDLSGAGRTPAQGTPSAQPTFRAAGHARGINGQPVVDWDGTSDYMDFGASAFSALSGGAEVFLIGRRDADPPPTDATSPIWVMGSSGDGSSLVPYSDGNVYEDFGSTTRKSAGNPAASLASPFSYNVVSIAGEFTVRVNGTQLYTTATNTVGWSATPRLGRTLVASWFFAGVTAEVVMTVGKMSATDRTELRTYFHGRYAVS